ncbi:hypothetical protein T12_828 [Trichinella patagoniensis]|uniref:Uncharacterized protein n=1 Tax=Trichinella patagoniensis TaxID=990121 RepID=A0A0V0Z3K0_9BILA|nr:hypothetical protein T12_828 [Trichinella patagoniensis]
METEIDKKMDSVITHAAVSDKNLMVKGSILGKTIIQSLIETEGLIKYKKLFDKDSIDQLENSVYTNHVRRERKETTRANFRQKAEQHNPHASIKAAVAGERAQFSFDVVFSAVVVLRRSSSHVRQAATPSLKHHRYLAEEFILATQ